MRPIVIIIEDIIEDKSSFLKNMQSHHTQIPNRHDGIQTFGNLVLVYIKNKTINFLLNYKRTCQIISTNDR